MSLYELVVALLNPYTLLILLSWLALANLWRKRRESRLRLLLPTVPLAALTLISLPAVGYGLLGTLEWRHPPLAQRPGDVGAIVVLAGYVFDPGGPRLYAELGESSLYRCLHAAEVYHQGKPCPILVTGGRMDFSSVGPSCAEVMGDFLTKLGVSPSDLIVEDRARSTYENAVLSAALLSRRQIHKIILVTDATHMLRATRCFRKLGLEVVPAGCRYRAISAPEFPEDFLPIPLAAHEFLVATHEWMGIAWYWLHDRI